MNEIVIFSMPKDRPRAALIIDRLQELRIAGVYPTKLVAEEPYGDGWSHAMNEMSSAACVVVCWSRHTSGAKTFRSLAASLCESNRAILVEFDAGTRPKALATVTTYDLNGWRGSPNYLLQFITGSCYVDHVAVAAQQKALGLDPPPPSALRNHVRRRVWAAVGVVGVVLGIASNLLGVWGPFANARFRAPEVGAAFDSARTSATPCAALRAFVQEHSDGPWTDEATSLISTCYVRDTVKLAYVEQPLEVFGATMKEARRDGESKCGLYAKTANARLDSVRVEGFVAGARAIAICAIEQPIVERVERMTPLARE